MTRKTKKKINSEEHEFVTIEVTNYHAVVDVGRNYELVNLDRCDSDIKVFRCDSEVDIEGKCIYPENLKDHTHLITIYGTENHDDRFSLTLHDCQERQGVSRVYKTVKGEEVPVYELPDGIGFIEKRRGEKCWSGVVWVLPRAVTDMLCMLPRLRPLYLEIHRVKKEKAYAIRSISLKTKNPV